MYIVEIYNLIRINNWQLNSWYKKWTVTSENVIVDLKIQFLLVEILFLISIVDTKNSYPAKE